MRLDRLRFAAAAAAIVFLAACGDNAGLPAGAPGAQRERGGSFSAQHVGSLRYVPCSESKTGHFFFHGLGRAAYFHQNVENGALIVRPSGGHCLWNGTATMTSLEHRSDSIVFTLSIKDGFRYDPCDAGARYAVKRGTGKFARASGSGAIFFDCYGSDFTDSWSGTITF